VRWPSSLRSRLTLWYTLLLAVPLIAFALVCYVVVSRTLERRTDVFIGDALTAFARELVAERRAAWPIRETMQRTVDEVRFRELHIAILDRDAQVVAMGALAEGDAEERDNPRQPSVEIENDVLASLRTSARRDGAALTVASHGRRFRVLTRPFVADSSHYTLTGTYALRDIDDVLQRLRELFQLAIPVLLVTAAFGGNALARRSLSPVAAMARQAAAISERNLHERLPASGGDELVGLARVVNGLLDRLESSFDRQRRFIADASHELRTPTAVVRTEADVTLSREHRTEEDYRGSVAIIRDAAQRLTRIVDDLFLLSRADSGHLVTRRDTLYLEEVVHHATRAVRSVAQQRGVEVELRSVVEAPCVGDADLLGRLVLNLLDNAIKYSPSGSTAIVEVSTEPGWHVVSVIDAGPGIPLADRERVFERFVRLDAARARVEESATSGAGLGLAIGRRIAELHGGRLVIADSVPGRTEFRVTIPALPAA
jgi:two-component system, OmpR family, sensor kinase